MCYKLEYKKKEVAGSKIRNMSGSTDREQSSTDRETGSTEF